MLRLAPVLCRGGGGEELGMNEEIENENDNGNVNEMR